MADTRTVGFIGIAQKGPMDVPTRIGHWDEYVEIFGYERNHYLSDTVETFFRNGGRSAVIVRVAHSPRGEEPRAEAHAACAERILLDDWQKPALRVRAQSEGRWGNDVWVRCSHARGASTLLTRDLEVGAGEAYVASTRGFEVGSLVRIFDREHDDFVILTEVDDAAKRLGFSHRTPVNRQHFAAAPSQAEVLELELHAVLKDRREVFKRLQMHPSSRQYAPRVIEARSRLIRLDDLQSPSPIPHGLAAAEPLSKLADGRDGSEALSPRDVIGEDLGPAARWGLMALQVVDEVALLACPDAMLFAEREPGPAGEAKAQRVQDALVEDCELRKDRFALLDCPRTRDVEQVKRWRRRTDSSHAAYYWPWIDIATPHGTRELPPSGLMAGIYAHQESAGGVHYPPANVPVAGAADLSLRITEDDLGALNAEGINSFRVQRGIRPWGARTASSDPSWRYVNVRRLFIMLRRSIEEGLAWVAFEPHHPATWTAVQTEVASFLGELFQKGMFAGGNAAEAFYVKCDAETNAPEEIEAGRLLCHIGVAPVVPTEFMIIDIIQTMAGAEL